MSHKLGALQDAEPAKPAAGRSECSVPEPVAVKRLRVRDKVVEFPDGPILDCRFAARLGQWASDLVIPVVFGGLGTELKAVRTGPGFECRNRNHASSGKLSAHATGLAVDVAGFDLANGNHLLVTEATDEAKGRVLRTLRTGAWEPNAMQQTRLVTPGIASHRWITGRS